MVCTYTYIINNVNTTIKNRKQIIEIKVAIFTLMQNSLIFMYRAFVKVKLMSMSPIETYLVVMSMFIDFSLVLFIII